MIFDLSFSVFLTIFKLGGNFIGFRSFDYSDTLWLVILSMIWLQAENPEPAEQWNLEELTWERMLGLDGSFVFLEHVFWVISLNSLFIFIFAYLPYHLGTGLFQNFRFGQKVSESHIDGIVSTITGTLIISFNRSRFYQYLWFIDYEIHL